MMRELTERLSYPRLPRACIQCLLVLNMICAALLPAGAQATEVPRGARVRIDHGTIVTGTFVGTRNDTLLIAGDEYRDTTRVPLSRVSGVEVSVGRPAHVVMGAALGAVLGVISGAAVLVAAGSPRGDGPLAGSRSAQAIGVAVVGALVGAAVGAGVGSLARSDRWEPVVYPHFGR